MISFHISGTIRFFIGIVLVQAATGILVMVAMNADNRQAWLLLALLALTFGLITAFWFASIMSHARQDATARLREGFSREREKIKVRAEKEKTKVMEKSHQQIIKERSRVQAKANTKTGAMFAAVLALGGIMVFTQFVTFGLLLMSAAGGALGGYLLRSRQLTTGSGQKALLPLKKDRKLLEKG